jgi:hypothetical protein
MAKNSRPSGNKRARERAQAERNKEKASRRLERKELKANAGPRPEGEDPDLAGIQAGPQPRPEWLDLPDEEEDKDDSGDEDKEQGKS